jgi:hypothetical protein
MKGVVAGGSAIERKASRQQLEDQLQANLAELRSLYRKLAPAQAWLEGRIAFSEEAQKPDLEARKLELDRRAEEAERRIAQADADIAALADPSSDASTYQAILARLSSTGGPVRVPERRLA